MNIKNMAFRLDRTAYKRVYVSRRRQLVFECNQDLNMYNKYSNILLKEFVTIIWLGNKVLKFESDKKWTVFSCGKLQFRL